jgi:hypothetical protein
MMMLHSVRIGCHRPVPAPCYPLVPDYGVFHCPRPVFDITKGEIVREDDGLLGHLFLT